MPANKIHLNKTDDTEISVVLHSVDEDSPLTHREMHLHEEYEIFIPMGGDDAFELDGRLCIIPENSLVLIRPYELHRCVFRSKEPHSYFWILLRTDESLMESFFGQNERNNIITLQTENFEKLTDCLFGMLEKKSKLEQYIAFFSMLDIIKKGEFAQVIEEKDFLPKDMVRALEYMERYMSEKIDIRTVAKVSMVSINTLERHFSEYLQLSPSEALRRKRLINAADLLTHGASVSEACEKSGFTDYSNFIVMFRKVYGMTPLKYQKSAKKQS